jgi:hypothetical protein
LVLKAGLGTVVFYGWNILWTEELTALGVGALSHILSFRGCENGNERYKTLPD